MKSSKIVALGIWIGENVVDSMALAKLVEDLGNQTFT